MDPTMTEKGQEDISEEQTMESSSVVGHDDNKANLHQIGSTQKQLTNTRRILWVVSFLAVLMMCTIFSLSLVIVKLMDDSDIVVQEKPTAGFGEPQTNDQDEVVIATVAEGFTIHHAELAQDPYGLTTRTGSLFFPNADDASDAQVTQDAYDCSIADYIGNAKLLGQVQACRGVYYSAERSQTISILSAQDQNLARGQSMASVSFQPSQVWMDPIIESSGSAFNDETVYLVMGTTGADCHLLVFIEDVTKTYCPYYEIPDCAIPRCVSKLPPVDDSPARPIFNN